VEALVQAIHQAVRLIADRAVAINPWWVVAGVILYEASQVVRTRGWFNILRATYPDARSLRARDVTGAYLAGVGLNAVLPARGGDFLKLFMVRRRLPSARYPTLVATFLPETLFECLCGIALVVWALTRGFLPVPVAPNELPELDVSFILGQPLLSAAGAAVLAICAVLLARVLRRRWAGLGTRLRQGLAILSHPREFVLGVASWQALGRLIRLGGLACFMAALGLPLTPGTAVLVMAAQGAGRIVPLAPVSAGLRVAMLSYGFVEVTDSPVDVAAITAFWFTVGAAHLITSVTLAIGVIGATFGTFSPRRALAAARRASAHERPTPATVPGLTLPTADNPEVA
jgi:Lysylphosphatidylglycerol synthase TM region